MFLTQLSWTWNLILIGFVLLFVFLLGFSLPFLLERHRDPNSLEPESGNGGADISSLVISALDKAGLEKEVLHRVEDVFAASRGYVPRVIDWASRLLTLNFLFAVFGLLMSLSIVFVSLLQAKRLEDQNMLFEAQNEKIENQLHLAEAARRSALIIELSTVIGLITSQAKPADGSYIAVAELGQPLIARIVALSRSLRPYRYIDYSSSLSQAANDAEVYEPVRLRDRALSPERGQLLVALLNVEISNYLVFARSAPDFSSSDLENVEFHPGLAKLSELTLSGSSFKNATINSISFEASTLIGVDFSGASLAGSSFSIEEVENDIIAPKRRVDVTGSIFYGADLSDVMFNQAILTRSDFRHSLISGASFLNASLECSNFDGAIIDSINAFDNIDDARALVDEQFFGSDFDKSMWTVVQENGGNENRWTKSHLSYYKLRLSPEMSDVYTKSCGSIGVLSRDA